MNVTRIMMTTIRSAFLSGGIGGAASGYGYGSTVNGGGGGGGYDGRGGLIPMHSTPQPLSTQSGYHDKERRRQAMRVHAVLGKTGRALIQTAALAEPSMHFADHASGTQRQPSSPSQQLPHGLP